MVKIRKLKRVRGIPSLKKPNSRLCKNCQIGKMGKTSFKRKNYQSEEVWRSLGDGIYITQSKYINEILKKFGMEDSRLVGTPMCTRHNLIKNDDSKVVDQTLYK